MTTNIEFAAAINQLLVELQIAMPRLHGACKTPEEWAAIIAHRDRLHAIFLHSQAAVLQQFNAATQQACAHLAAEAQILQSELSNVKDAARVIAMLNVFVQLAGVVASAVV